MKTDVIVVSSKENQMEEVLSIVEKVAVYKELSRKNALHLRLLAEEMMGMIHSIAREAYGEFWIADQNGVFELHLQMRTLLDDKQREQLISASTSGKNDATRGLMGKIRAFFEMSGETPMFSGLFMLGSAPQMYGSLVWSMEDYREQLRQYSEKHHDDAQEAWDELEKSVIAHVADDVRVSIMGRTAEMTIIKKFGPSQEAGEN